MRSRPAGREIKTKDATMSKSYKFPRAYILKADLDSVSEDKKTGAGLDYRLIHKPTAGSCVMVCEHFMSYPVTNGMGMRNGIRIIPNGKECPNLPGVMCNANNWYLHPVFLPKGAAAMNKMLKSFAGDLKHPNDPESGAPRQVKIERLKKILQKLQKETNMVK
jgi:hypothetical protein